MSVLCIHFEVSNDGFTLWSLLNLQTLNSKYSKVYIPALFLTMHLIFIFLAEKYFGSLWKSGLSKTRPAKLVLLPLVCLLEKNLVEGNTLSRLYSLHPHISLS